MRILVTDKKTTTVSLKDQLLSKKLNAGQSQAALASLQKLNPHVDLANVTAGTVLFVPDTPDFQPTGSDSVFGDVLADFERLIKTSLDSATSRAKAASDAAADESNEVTKTFKTAAFKKVAAQDAELQSAVDAATTAFKNDKADRDQATATLSAASKDALAAFKDLSAQLGTK